ncbi:MAG: class I SAM-dependent methyltransferase [Microgenomates group bacterium]
MSKWDQYFQTYLRPIATSWTKHDVLKYANWYWGWITYIQATYNIQFAGKKVIEIGSGAGGVCYLLKNQGADITGSDVSKMMIKNAHTFIGNIPFIYCDIQKSIPTKIKYDYIIGFEVLEHLPYPSEGVSNIYKALKPGGKFIGSSPFPFQKNLADPTHLNVKYPEEWKKMFMKAGFTHIVCKPMSFFPLLWRIHRSLNIPLPFYISVPGFVSTTLLVAWR